MILLVLEVRMVVAVVVVIFQIAVSNVVVVAPTEVVMVVDLPTFSVKFALCMDTLPMFATLGLI